MIVIAYCTRGILELQKRVEIDPKGARGHRADKDGYLIDANWRSKKEDDGYSIDSSQLYGRKKPFDINVTASSGEMGHDQVPSSLRDGYAHEGTGRNSAINRGHDGGSPMRQRGDDRPRNPQEDYMDALVDAARDEIFTLFPELRDNAQAYGPAARTSLKGHEAKVLSENPDFLN